MAEWWIWGKSLQRKMFDNAWVIFQEYVPDREVYSMGMSKPINNRYDAYWSIFFKVDRATANRIFKIMKQLYTEGFLKAYKPVSGESLSKQEKIHIAQKIAEKLGRGFKIIVGDEEISISPPDPTGPPPDVPLPPPPSTGGDTSATFPGFSAQPTGPGLVSGFIPGSPPPRYMNPQAQLVNQQQNQESSKKKWLFIGGGGLLFIILIVVAVFFLKRK